MVHKAWAAGLAAVCLSVSTTVLAQGYPNRPIRVIVPLAAGSGTDILARIVTENLRGALGAQFVVKDAGIRPE
jgi:tripartite-type tricarboxylate transporter receptor subunit TctC